MPARQVSIRRRLLIFLAAVLLVVVAAAAGITYRVALRVANDAYDRSLLNTAFAFAQNVRDSDSGIRLDLTARAQNALLFDEQDKLFFVIRDAAGAVVAGNGEMPPAAGTTGGIDRLLYDSVLRAEPIRVAALRSEQGIVVEVAETLNKRNQLVRDILVAELVPTLVVVLAALTLGWLGIARGLAPLERVRADLARRSAADLRPLDTRHAPDEVRPAVVALNELLDRLRTAAAAQHRFLANAAHQLRTPLAGLQMQLELLIREVPPSQIREELQKMHAATERTTRLAQQLLALARAEQTQDDQDRSRSFDLYDICDAAARDWAPRAIAREIDLGFDLAHATIDGDPVMMRELVNNLIDNALAYTPRGGVVTVRCGIGERGAFLAVEDDGPGIPHPMRARVFDRFFRVDGSPGEGSGLGLAIVKEVAERHRADVEIESGAGKKGAHVVVKFPARASTVAPGRGAGAPPARAPDSALPRPVD